MSGIQETRCTVLTGVVWRGARRFQVNPNFMFTRNYVMTVLGYLFVLILAKGALEVPKHNSESVYSPDKRFQLRVSATSEQYIRNLAVTDQGREIARYKFEGDLVNAYWSPSASYVAINNHFGYRGWYVWIISLRDGAVIRSTTATKSAQYDRYLDDKYEPNVPELAKSRLKELYPKFRDDSSREHYISLAWGWKNRNQLRMFHVLGFDNLYEKENAEVWIETVFNISENGISVGDISARKVVGKGWKEYPGEVRKTLEKKPTTSE